MEVRYLCDPETFKRLNTSEVRGHFLIDTLFPMDAIKLVYSHVDRMIIGSAVPAARSLALEAGGELAADYFAERREIGVINVGQSGQIEVDGQRYALANRDMLYIGMGSREITFFSDSASDPARFYLVSLPAHMTYPTTHIPLAQAHKIALGSDETSNNRTIYQYVHLDGVQSCQLVMGFTELHNSSIWNTMPAHTHDRRSEVYMYFDLEDDDVVFHLMGEPHETRHIVMHDGQAAISPSWSIHAGAGTRSYCFVWAMGGENQAFSDMDMIAMSDLA